MASYEVYIRKFRISVMILGATILLFVILLMQVLPNIEKITKIQKNTRSQSSSLADMERRLEDLKKTEEEKEDTSNLAKAFFKPINGGVDTETAIADEFAEILQIMRDNKIKTRSIKYDYEDALQDDNFVKFAANKYHVCRVTADMIGSYQALENFLRDLYKHEHFLEISKVEIVPYEKNKRILLANIQIKLYAQRDPSTVVEEVTPAATSANNSANPDEMGGMPSSAPSSQNNTEVSDEF